MITRRTLIAVSGFAALAAPQIVRASCGANMSTPVATDIDSPYTIEQAYLDTTIPYHKSGIALANIGLDDIEDDRVLEVTQSLLDTFPAELDELHALREGILGEAEPDEPTREMMLLAMGGVESCTDETHMDFMRSEWIAKTYAGQDDKPFAFVNMMVLLLEMEMHQHMVAEQLSENEDLLEFCTRMHELRDPQIAVLKEVRGELISAY